MPYRITVFEPSIERRDHPTLIDQTQRTAVTKRTRREALASACELLDKHAEVRIWNVKKAIGHLLEGWVSSRIIILSKPRQVLSDTKKPSSRGDRRAVDWYVYEYFGSDGQIYRKEFETIPDEPPQVPRFGTHEVIDMLHYQWQCWDCRGDGWSNGDRDCNETCYTCGGSGLRDKTRPIVH